MSTIKEKIYNIIRDDDKNDLISNIVDGTIIALIILNIVIVIADTFAVSASLSRIFTVVEIVSVIIFSVEYLLRLWTADLRFASLPPARARVKHIFSFMAIVDLLAILPFFLPFVFSIDLIVLRALRIVRLLRLFKMNRYTNALSSIGNVFKRKASQLLSSMFVVAILMIITSVIMCNVEGLVQPEVFQNAFSGLWWAVATFTTVGYGDIYPITVVGKILSGVMAILGIGLVAVPTGIISAGFMEEFERAKVEQSDEEKHFCPYCGRDLREH
jgi:voltage-gated potassium channel